MGLFSVFRRKDSSPGVTPPTSPPSKPSLVRRLSLGRAASSSPSRPSLGTGPSALAPKIDLPVLSSNNGVFDDIVTRDTNVDVKFGEVAFKENELELLGKQRFTVDQARRAWEVVGKDLRGMDLSSPSLLPASLYAASSSMSTGLRASDLPTLTDSRMGLNIKDVFGPTTGAKDRDLIAPASPVLRLAALFTLSHNPLLLPSLPSLSPILPLLLPPTHDFSVDFADASAGVREASELLEILGWVMRRTDYAPSEGGKSKGFGGDGEKETRYREAVFQVLGMLVAFAPSNGLTLRRISARWGWWVLGRASRLRDKGGERKYKADVGVEELAREWEDTGLSLERMFLAWLRDQAKIQTGLPLNLLNLLTFTSMSASSDPASGNPEKRSILRVDLEAVIDPSESTLTLEEILKAALGADLFPPAGEEKTWAWEAWRNIKDDEPSLSSLLTPESYRLVRSRIPKVQREDKVPAFTSPPGSPSKATPGPTPLEFRPFHTPSSSYFSLAASPSTSPNGMHSRKRSLTHDGVPVKPPSPKSPRSNPLGSLREESSGSIRSGIPSWRDFEEVGFGNVGDGVLGEDGGLKEPFELALGRDGSTKKMTPRWAPLKHLNEMSPTVAFEEQDEVVPKSPRVGKRQAFTEIKYTTVSVKETTFPSTFFPFFSDLTEDQTLSLELPESVLLALATEVRPACNILFIILTRKPPPPPPIDTSTASAISISPKMSPTGFAGWKRTVSGTAGKRNSFIRALSGELKPSRSGKGLASRISEPVSIPVKKEIPFDPEEVHKGKSRSSTMESVGAVTAPQATEIVPMAPIPPSPDSSKSAISHNPEGRRSRATSMISIRRKPVPEVSEGKAGRNSAHLETSEEELNPLESAGIPIGFAISDEQAASHQLGTALAMGGTGAALGLAAMVANNHLVGPAALSDDSIAMPASSSSENGFKRSLAPSPSPRLASHSIPDLAPPQAGTSGLGVAGEFPVQGVHDLKLFFVDLAHFSPSEEVFAKLLGSLDQQSIAKVRKFHFRKDALRCLVGRLLPRWYVSSMEEHAFNCEEAKSFLEFSTTAGGKPFLASPRTAVPLEFNISHDQDLVLCGIGHGFQHIGVDVMAIDRQGGSEGLEEVLVDQLHPDEMKQLSASTQPKIPALLQAWTIKEAYTKALGVGLGMDFKRIAVMSSGVLRIDDQPLPSTWSMATGVTGHAQTSGIVKGYRWSVVWQRGELDTPAFSSTAGSVSIIPLPIERLTEWAGVDVRHQHQNGRKELFERELPAPPIMVAAATIAKSHRRASQQPPHVPSRVDSLNGMGTVPGAPSAEPPSGRAPLGDISPPPAEIDLGDPEPPSAPGLSPSPVSAARMSIGRKTSGSSGTSLTGIGYDGKILPKAEDAAPSGRATPTTPTIPEAEDKAVEADAESLASGSVDSHDFGRRPPRPAKSVARKRSGLL